MFFNFNLISDLQGSFLSVILRIRYDLIKPQDICRSKFEFNNTGGRISVSQVPIMLYSKGTLK